MFAFPIILYVVGIAIALIFVRYESPKFLINKEDLKNARLMIAQIYSKNEDVEEIIEYYMKNC